MLTVMHSANHARVLQMLAHIVPCDMHVTNSCSGARVQIEASTRSTEVLKVIVVHVATQ